MEYQAKLKVLLTFLIFLFTALSVGLVLLAFGGNSHSGLGGASFISGGNAVVVPVTPVNPPAQPEVSPPAAVTPSEVVTPPPATGVTDVAPPAAVVRQPPPHSERRVIARHHVVSGDTVSGIAFARWGNAYLWPDLYINNVWRSDDPDLIFPGEVVDIFNRLGPNGRFTAEEINAINEAYIQVYNMYRALGTLRDNSRIWTLTSATRAIPDFLERNSGRLDAADVATARRHLEESRALR
ncbi:MAG: hypothetical protein FWE37_07485 [Spirochaetaceae bacterium]|nr:hypothetical protein [Spirochaetaceae bacterium]